MKTGDDKLDELNAAVSKAKLALKQATTPQEQEQARAELVTAEQAKAKYWAEFQARSRAQSEAMLLKWVLGR